jgi:hypothetical protein
MEIYCTSLQLTLLLTMNLTNDRPVQPPERAPHKEKSVRVKLYLIWGSTPRRTRLTDRQSLCDFDSVKLAEVAAPPTSRQQNKNESPRINTVTPTPHSNNESPGSNTGSRLRWRSPRSIGKSTAQRPARNNIAAAQGRPPTLAQPSSLRRELLPASIRCARPQT